ncbi:oligosaccharide flippase family protein [Algoriphagus pacificus]|uniref:Oligosaccharide flippase family protein n=1 Tax=Algoriphagus pacificus TaxID=2811234 RepID=A0ABS3CGY6_9BACT|nr:oligosaccharide flippase family protein [Algoriphagus pacificus]MBN7816348.1 oligosaccharide flippase family protein [Algoriphagus pacificus]
MSIKKKILKNTFASSISKLFRVTEQLILVPFFIAAWGANYYGEWLTLTIFPTILAFSDLGFGTASANMMVLKYASSDYIGASKMAKIGPLMTSTFVLIGFFISFLIIFSFYKFSFFDSLLIKKYDAIISLSFMMTAQLIGLFRQFYEGYFRIAQKSHQAMHLNNLYQFFNIFSGFIVLTFGGNVIHFSMTYFIVSILYTFLFVFLAKKKVLFKEIKFSSLLFDDIKNVAQKGIGFMLSPLWQSIYFQGSTFVVRIVLGPGAVAIFNTVRTLTRGVNQIYSIINVSVFPEIQFLIGQKKFPKVRLVFRYSLLITIFTAVLGVLFLFSFGLQFYKFWTNNELDPPIFMWNIFLLSICFNSIWWTSGVVFRAFNRPFRFVIAGFIASLFSVGLTFILSKSFGLIGASIGYIFLDVSLAFYILPLSCKMIGQNPLHLFKDFFMDFSMILKKNS